MISSLLIALVAGQTYLPDLAIQPDPQIRPRIFRSDGPPRLTRLGSDSFSSLCAAVAAGDKSGAWECMLGDGTMLAGSATTFVATGTPTNTVENGFPVRTYTTAQNDQQPANVAFPASDFSICQHVRPGTVAVTQLAAFGTAGAAATFVSLPFEVQSGAGQLMSYISNGAAGGTFASSPSLTAGQWYLLCYTYQRVGGASNNEGTVYLNGSSIASSSTQNLAQALTSVWTTNGYALGVLGMAKSIRGEFITYKLLSAADVARINAAVGP